MKHSVYQLLLAGFFASLVSANPSEAQEILSRPVTIQVANQELRTVLAQLHQQADIRFTYSSSLIASRQRVTYSATNRRLSTIMDDLFKPLSIGYRVEGRRVVLFKLDKPDRSSLNILSPNQLSLPNAETPADPQDQTISGKVTDENGNGMPGVSIVLKGTQRGTTSNNEGNYSIAVPNGNAILVFSFVGYMSREEVVGSRSSVNVALAVDNKSLNEVVVVGYTTQAKRDITGAVSTVKVEDLQAVPATNFAQQLQGRAAGVQVSSDGAPGGGVAVRIRGIGSITGANDPLYIIDGVPTQGGLNQLNPNDIETMQVLKDASTASVYGARASNGVIIVTTKRGRSGEARIEFNSYVGSQTYNKLPQQVTPQQWADMQWTNYRNTGQVDPKTGNPVNQYYGSGATPVLPDYIIPSGAMNGDPRVNPANYSIDYNDPAYGKTKFPITLANKAGTDWFQEITRSAPIRSYNLSVSGGSEKSRYAVTGGYFDQQGILKFTGFKRYSLRANSEFTVKKILRIGENLQFSYTDDVSVNMRQEQSPITAAYLSPRIQSVFDINGYYSGERGGGMVGNNAYSVLERNKDNHNYNGRIFGNLYAEADVWKNLTARTSFGLDYINGNSSNFTLPGFESLQRTQVPILTVGNNYGLNWTWTNTLNYQATLGSEHRISALAGTEAVKNTFRSFSTSKTDFAFTDINYRYLDAGAKVLGSSGGGSDSRLFSLFAKVDYGFGDKYLLSATVRQDASSRFAPGFRRGVFPAFSAGWRISGENFMKGVKFIDDLKLRASWGKTGNQEIDNYNQYSTYTTSLVSSSYDIRGTGNSVVSGFEARRLGNPNAQWEAQTMANLGLDATLFNGRLDLTVDAYNRQSSKLLLVVPGPATDGQNARPAVNVGGMRNTGLDVLVNYRGNSMGNALKYNIGLNWSTYKNEVTDLYAGEGAFITGFDTRLGAISRTEVGRPIASFYGYVVDGILQTQEEANAYPTQGGDRTLLNQPGRFKFRDVNGDKKVDADDRTFIGNPNPKFTYGVNLNASYKGFDATVFLQGVQGNDLFNYQKYYTDFWNFLNSPSVRMLDSWTPQNTGAMLPKINSNATPWESQASTYYIEKGSYLRAKNVQLGYTLPATLLNRAKIDRVRVYVQASNLFTLTNYSGFDPEVNLAYYGSGADRDLGVDRGVYPVAKSFLVGLQVGF